MPGRAPRPHHAGQSDESSRAIIVASPREASYHALGRDRACQRGRHAVPSYASRRARAIVRITPLFFRTNHGLAQDK